MIIIKEANSKALLKEYVKFPFSLYKNHLYWVPPLIQEELDSFDKTKNPAFESAEAYFYLAYKNDQIVGRIAAIINWDEVNNQEKKKDDICEKELNEILCTLTEDEQIKLIQERG